ncbi:hypothetical protein Ahia01_000405200 [Argonauta hians]
MCEEKLIVWTNPSIPSWNSMYMLEAMTFKVCVRLESNALPESILVQAWTNIYEPRNNEGCWHAIDLPFIEPDIEQPGQPDDTGKSYKHLIYGTSVLSTGYGVYQFTYRVRYNTPVSNWMWKNAFKADGVISISPPTMDKWTQGPDYNHIIDNIYCGNFIAATKAEELGFDAVLNMAENLDIVLKPDSKLIYKKISVADGAHNSIEDCKIKEAVDWLVTHKSYKTLVNCRAGVGRAGSTLISYVFMSNPKMSYEDAYSFVYNKRFIYPHRGLKDSLMAIYR